MATSVVSDDVIVRLERALTGMVRLLQLPRVVARVVGGSGPGLERAAYGALRRIHDQGGLRLSELAAELELDASTVSRQVRQLEAAGLVARRADPGDGRASVVVLTPAGKRVLGRVAAARRRFVAEVVAGWSEEDRVALAGLLERFGGDVAACLSTSTPSVSWSEESRP
ncbi:MAG: MarR family transcriptional regulator [Actinomycetota bacterium]